MITGAIRESIGCGMPVVSSITPATPKLNEKRESILLAEKENYNQLAQHMVTLIKNPNKANELRDNGLHTIAEKYNNDYAVKGWRDAYLNILR